MKTKRPARVARSGEQEKGFVGRIMTNPLYPSGRIKGQTPSSLEVQERRKMPTGDHDHLIHENKKDVQESPIEAKKRRPSSSWGIPAGISLPFPQGNNIPTDALIVDAQQ